MRSFLIFCLGILSVVGIRPASATVSVAIDLSTQRMHVTSARGTFDWPISSARAGYVTPGGTFAPTAMMRMAYSRKYNMSPMPHSIFFHGGYAIHGSYATGSLGHPASHGCVRLSPANAATLYGMVQAEGARISISGVPPASRPFGSEYAGRRGRTAVARSAAPTREGVVARQPNKVDIFNMFSSDASEAD